MWIHIWDCDIAHPPAALRHKQDPALPSGAPPLFPTLPTAAATRHPCIQASHGPDPRVREAGTANANTLTRALVALPLAPVSTCLSARACTDEHAKPRIVPFPVSLKLDSRFTSPSPPLLPVASSPSLALLQAHLTAASRECMRCHRCEARVHLPARHVLRDLCPGSFLVCCLDLVHLHTVGGVATTWWRRRRGRLLVILALVVEDERADAGHGEE